MVSRLLELKNAIMALKGAQEINQNLGEIDWEVLELLKTILGPFMKMQLFFEGSKYVTISFIPLMMRTLREIINNTINVCTQSINGSYCILNSEGNPFLHETIQKNFLIVSEMKKKFEERWGTGLMVLFLLKISQKGIEESEKVFQI